MSFSRPKGIGDLAMNYGNLIEQVEAVLAARSNVGPQ